MTDLQDDDQAQESRASAFQDGIAGGSLGARIATSLPRVQQAAPAFNASASTLLIQNSMRTINGVSDSAT
jgi:hypothetical protein